MFVIEHVVSGERPNKTLGCCRLVGHGKEQVTSFEVTALPNSHIRIYSSSLAAEEEDEIEDYFWSCYCCWLSINKSSIGVKEDNEKDQLN